MKVLRAGRSTRTMLRFKNGVQESTLLNIGHGIFLGNDYENQADARRACDSALSHDPSAIIHIVLGDKILETVLDLEFQRKKNKKKKAIYSVILTIVIFALPLNISLFLMPFTSLLGHGLFIGGMTFLYVLALFIYGAGNFEALIVMIIFLSLIAFSFRHS